jgi:hypothetical protein
VAGKAAKPKGQPKGQPGNSQPGTGQNCQLGSGQNGQPGPSRVCEGQCQEQFDGCVDPRAGNPAPDFCLARCQTQLSNCLARCATA